MLMMPRTGEFYAHTKNDFEISRGRPPMDTLEERLRFVKAMRWFPEEFSDDTDRYDLKGDTYHFARHGGDGSIVAAMRLTPIESIEASLSYEMMGGNLELQAAAAKSQEALRDFTLWDLTRLVFPLDKSHDGQEIEEAMIELFGMAAQVSAGGVDDPKPDVNWVFTTTAMILRFLQEAGIPRSDLAKGKLPNSDGIGKTTYFCTVNVATAIQALGEKYKHTYALLKKGADAAETGLLYA